MRPASPSATLWRPTGLAAAFAVLVVVVPLGAASAGDTVEVETERAEWLEVLERAADAARHTRYQGETLLLGLDGERSTTSKGRVRNTPEGGLELGAGNSPHGPSGAQGAGLVGKWTVAPPPPVGGAADDFDRMSSKYDVVVVPDDRVMDRPCSVLEIRRRTDGALRERLWVDEESGLLLRRETFEDGEEPVRLAMYLSLDLNPGRPRGPMVEEAAEASTLPEPIERLEGKGLEPVDERGLAALREAGWTIPGGLPEGYAPIGAYSPDAGTSQPLQLVFGDGLYVVSVFQQQGTPDWTSLPAGARRVDELDFPAYEWPGAVPHRLVWEADGRTFSLVGDAPPADLVRLAAALPQPDEPGALERLRRGLGRLWSWVTPWG